MPGPNDVPQLEQLKRSEQFNFVADPSLHTNARPNCPPDESREINMGIVSMVTPEEGRDALGFAAPVPAVMYWKDEVTGETRKGWFVNLAEVEGNKPGEHLVPVTADGTADGERKLTSAGSGVEALFVDPDIYKRTGGNNGYLSLRLGRDVHVGPWTRGQTQWFEDGKYRERFPGNYPDAHPMLAPLPGQLPAFSGEARKPLDVTARLEGEGPVRRIVIGNQGSEQVMLVYSATTEMAYDPLPPEGEASQGSSVVDVAEDREGGEPVPQITEKSPELPAAVTEEHVPDTVSQEPASTASSETPDLPTGQPASPEAPVTVPVLSEVPGRGTAIAPEQVLPGAAMAQPEAFPAGSPEAALRQFGQRIEAVGVDEAIAGIPAARTEGAPLPGVIEAIVNKGGIDKLLARLDELGRGGIEPDEVVNALPVSAVEMLRVPQEMMRFLPRWSPMVAGKAREILRNNGIDFLFPDETDYDRYLVKVPDEPDMWLDEQGNKFPWYR